MKKEDLIEFDLYYAKKNYETCIHCFCEGDTEKTYINLLRQKIDCQLRLSPI